MKSCDGRLHYETFGGSRVFRTVGRRRVYPFRCPKCGRSGENDGRAKTCRRREKRPTNCHYEIVRMIYTSRPHFTWRLVRGREVVAVSTRSYASRRSVTKAISRFCHYANLAAKRPIEE